MSESRSGSVAIEVRVGAVARHGGVSGGEVSFQRRRSAWASFGSLEGGTIPPTRCAPSMSASSGGGAHALCPSKRPWDRHALVGSRARRAVDHGHPCRHRHVRRQTAAGSHGHCHVPRPAGESNDGDRRRRRLPASRPSPRRLHGDLRSRGHAENRAERRRRPQPDRPCRRRDDPHQPGPGDHGHGVDAGGGRNDRDRGELRRRDGQSAPHRPDDRRHRGPRAGGDGSGAERPDHDLRGRCPSRASSW